MRTSHPTLQALERTLFRTGLGLGADGLMGPSYQELVVVPRINRRVMHRRLQFGGIADGKGRSLATTSLTLPCSHHLLSVFHTVLNFQAKFHTRMPSLIIQPISGF